MKIAVVGNSHLAALKLAVQRNLFTQERLGIAFWGLPGPDFNAITYSAGTLQTPFTSFVLHISDGLYESLPVREFDAIVFHGVALNVGDYLLSLRKAREHLRCYSNAVLGDGLRSRIEQMPSWSLVRSLRAEFGGRLLMSAMPLSSEDGAKFKGISVSDDELAHLNHHIGAVLAEIGVEYLPQPPDTIRDSKYTKREFCVDSVRLTAKLCQKHPDDDYVHMNEQYGVRVL
ncbi:MAG TPA: hypothetical protein VMT58_08460, partial [Candidatus Binataceae bacterium]|nr:hypothetical protein [Candidatus Binataceae bacterium]